MMYAVEAVRIDTRECADTAWFDTLEEAESYAEEMVDKEWRVQVIETTGEPGDEGRILY